MVRQILDALLASLESEIIESEQAVIREYPQADAMFLVRVERSGGAPQCVGEWVILEHPGALESELGRGLTEESAWADAAGNMASVLWPMAV